MKDIKDQTIAQYARDLQEILVDLKISRQPVAQEACCIAPTISRVRFDESGHRMAVHIDPRRLPREAVSTLKNPETLSSLTQRLGLEKLVEVRNGVNGMEVVYVLDLESQSQLRVTS